MKKLIKGFFQNIRFKQKLIVVFLIVYILPMLLMAGWLCFNFYNQLLKNSLKDSENAGSTIATMISERIAVMKDTLSAVAADKRTTDVLNHMDNLKDYAMSDQIRDKTDLMSYLNMLTNTSNLYSLRIYMPDDYYFAHGNGVINTIDMASNTPWYNQYLKTPNKTCLLYNSQSLEYQSNGMIMSSEVPVLSMVMPLYDPNDFQQTIALAVTEISHTEIKSMMQEVKSQFSAYILENGAAYFVDGTDVLENSNMKLPDLASGWKQMSIYGKGVFYASQIDIANTNLKLVMVVPTESIARVITSQIIIIILIILTLSFAVSLLAIYFATSISKRLDVLLKKVNRIRKGNFDIGKSEAASDEIGVLDENLSFMAESIKNLMEEQNRLGQEMKATEARIAKAELLALQSQINPHFLYNTLDLVIWQSRFNNLPEMETLIKALSKFYKASLSRGSELVDLASELQHVESFITIQNCRYNNVISLEIAVPPDIRCKLPKITLQPFVENAIIHGILCKPNVKGKIIIRAENLMGFVRITIHDNGVGMSEDKVCELNTRISINEGGIGIFNVYERLRLYFGNDISLHFFSVINKGTDVTLIVPEAN